MTPPTFSKAKPPKQQHSWYTTKKRAYATLARIKLNRGRDEPPVEPRNIDPVAGLKPLTAWRDCKQDRDEVAAILKGGR